MFGFARPSVSTGYRRLYASLCQHHRTLQGRFAAMFHSYDAVFLYALAADAGLFDASCIPKQTCCRLRRIETRERRADAQVAEYCSNAAMLLLYTKLQDDKRDRSLIARLRAILLLVFFKRKFKQMLRYFTEKAPSLIPAIQQCIDAHHQMESETPRVPAIEQFVAPTADGFAALFAELCTVVNKPEMKQLFHQIGWNFGAALLANDCGLDWQKDQLSGDFNIVSDAEAALRAFAYASEQLAALITKCSEIHAGRSRAVLIIESVRTRIDRRANPEKEPCATRIPRTLGQRAIRLPQLAWHGLRTAGQQVFDRKPGEVQLNCLDPGMCCGLCCQRLCERGGEAACEACGDELGCWKPCEECGDDCNKECKDCGCC